MCNSSLLLVHLCCKCNVCQSVFGKCRLGYRLCTMRWLTQTNTTILYNTVNITKSHPTWILNLTLLCSYYLKLQYWVIIVFTKEWMDTKRFKWISNESFNLYNTGLRNIEFRSNNVWKGDIIMIYIFCFCENFVLFII